MIEFKECTVLRKNSPRPYGYDKHKQKINAPYLWKILSAKGNSDEDVVLLYEPYIEPNRPSDDNGKRFREWKQGDYYWEGTEFYLFNGNLYLEGGTWRC